MLRNIQGQNFLRRRLLARRASPAAPARCPTNPPSRESVPFYNADSWRSNRANRSGSAVSASGSTLSATSRSSFGIAGTVDLAHPAPPDDGYDSTDTELLTGCEAQDSGVLRGTRHVWRVAPAGFTGIDRTRVDLWLSTPRGRRGPTACTVSTLPGAPAAS